MNPSIPTALILTALASFILCAFLFGLAGDSRMKGTHFAHQMVGAAYAANGLRLVVQFLAARGVPDRLYLGSLLYIGFVVCIWFGSRSYIKPRPIRRSLLLVPAALAAWVAGAHALRVPLPWLALPDHLAGFVLFGLSGHHFWRLGRIRRFWEMPLLAILLWTQGAVTLTYPFTRDTRLAPYGFMLMALLAISIGLAFMIGALREEEHLLTQEVALRRQTEDDLRASEARFRSAMEATSDGLWDWDVATGVVYYSPAYSGMLGYNPQEWSNRLESWGNMIHPDDHDRVLAANHACIEGQVEAFEVEYRLRTRVGTYKWILGRGKAVARDAEGRATRLLGTHVDIDRRKLAELELLRLNRLYDLLSQLGQCLVRVGDRQELLDEFCRIAVQTGDYPLVWVGWSGPAPGELRPVARAGAERAAMDGVSLRSDGGRESLGIAGTCIREDRAVVCQDLRLARAPQEWLERAEAHRIRCAAAFPIHMKGQAVGVLQVCGREPGSFLDREVELLRQAAGDISFGLERFAMAAERYDLEAQVQQAQKMESLGTLAGGIAHDMNNVLGAVLGLASAHMEMQPDGSAAHRAFGTIIKASARGGEMVKRLLRFARRTPGEERDLDLNELVRDVVRILERTTLARIQVETDLAGDLRPIRGDGGSLTNALMNLCVNAVDAIEGNGRLRLRTRNLGPDLVEVIVADTGCGMAPEVLRRAMEPFYTTKPQGQGTGLGLPMVYSTLQAHRGQVELRSEPGLGTTVTLRIPAAPRPQGGPTAGPGPGREAPCGSLRVLVVDDDELFRASIAALLELLKHTCEETDSGEAALARLGQGPPPDVVILDLNMPGIGGAATLRRIRGLDPRLPVVVATGKADQGALDLVAAHGHTSLLEKPFGLDALRSCLGRAASGRRAGDPQVP
jgi:PAS domain S-box-containing protein